MSAQATTTTAPRVRPIRRIVTGHDANRRSIIVSDQASPHVMAIRGIPAHAVTDLWATRATPADCAAADTCWIPVQLAPPANGTVFRVVEFPPDKDWLGLVDTRAAFASMGESGAQALAGPAQQRHPFMHQTSSVDYALVMSGEIWAVLDEQETLMRAGDVLIQRGTNHAWSNRSEQPCLVAFVLIDAAPVAAPVATPVANS